MSDKNIRSAAETAGKTAAAIAEEGSGLIDRGIDGIRHGAERVREHAHAAGERVREHAQAAGERAGEIWSSARDTVGDLTDKNFSELTSDLRKVVKRHPGKAVAVSLLVGFALGSLLTRRRD